MTPSPQKQNSTLKRDISHAKTKPIFLWIGQMIYAVADPGFGQGGGPIGRRANFETGRIYAWFYIDLCQAAQNVCSNFGAGGAGPPGPPWIRYCYASLDGAYFLCICVDVINFWLILS